MGTELFGTLKKLARGRTPGQLVIQWTSRCNAACPQCGMRKDNAFPRHTIPPDTMRRILDRAGELGFAAVSFTGGEPFLDVKTLAEHIRYAGQAGIPYIRTGTNGYLFAGADRPGFTDRMKRIAETLADTPLRNLWISVDSADPETHEAMRGFPGLVKGIEKALPVFHAHGIYPSANLGINRNTGGAATRLLDPSPGMTKESWGELFHSVYKAAFHRFFRHVADMGFTMVNACYPMSVEGDARGLDAVYAATSADRVVRFTGLEKAMLFQALCDTIPYFRGALRIFSPRVSLRALVLEYSGETGVSFPCRGGVDYFFVDAEKADTFPCGYRGRDNLGKFQDLDPARLSARAFCRECDWECFRDPSELAGPLTELFHASGPVRKWLKHPELCTLWAKDLAYARACGFFDGRKPPDYKQMARHRGGGKEEKPAAMRAPGHARALG
jgi:hypothetical protein